MEPVRDRTDTLRDVYNEQRVLVWAPFGRDASVLCEVLHQVGIDCLICKDLREVRDQLRNGAGALLLTEETLTPPVIQLARDIEAQPSWSALHLTVLATGDETAQQRLKLRISYLGARRNITILTRPAAPLIVVTALESALRSRRQQYEERDLLARLRDLNENLEERVEERTDEVRQLALSLTLAEQIERRRIAQVLHDGLQQTLFAMQTHLNLARRGGAPDEHPEWIKRIVKVQGMLDEGIRTTRTLAVELSPPALQDEDLQAVLHWLALRMEEIHGLRVAVEVHSPCRVTDEGTRILLVQLVRELLFNIVKHAGVDHAHVELSEEGGNCFIRIIDEGAGFDPEAVGQRGKATGGLGLSSVRERLRLLGGSMDIESVPGGGTRTTILAPLAARARSPEKVAEPSQ